MQLLRTEFERRRFADAMARSYIEGAIEIGKALAAAERGRLRDAAARLKRTETHVDETGPSQSSTGADEDPSATS